jgi:nucleotide-binding universal stress UspA family protein
MAANFESIPDRHSEGRTAMAKIIVSYDGTDNDRDALALGSLLRDLGGEISLAYVRHTLQPDQAREALEEKEAEELLADGARALGDESIQRHVVVHASTGAGLWELAESERADVVVFGSDYRTADGAVMPGTSAQRLLTGGPVAVAIAPAGFRNHEPSVRSVGVLVEDDDSAVQTAKDLADALGATVAERHTTADLLVVGSSPASPTGHVNLTARAGYAIETAHTPVIAIARGTEVKFSKPGLVQRVAEKIEAAT